MPAIASSIIGNRLSFYKTAEEAKKSESPNATASPTFVKSLLNRELRRAFGITDEKSSLGLVFEIVPDGNDIRTANIRK